MAAFDPRMLMVGTQQPDTAGAVRTARQDEQNQEMNAQKILQSYYGNMNEREKARLSSTIAGAAQLKAFLDNDDIEGAGNFLQQRRQQLQTRMGGGENIDTAETDEALNLLKAGRIDELKNGVNGLMAAGQVYGIINPLNSAGGSTGVLADRLVKEGSAKSINEALQIINGGAGQAGRNNAMIQTGGAASQTQELGKQGAQQIIQNNNDLGSLNNLDFAIQQAQALLPQVAMTGPILGRAGSAAEDPAYKNLQGVINSITLQAKDLYNLGSGQGFTDADRDFLRQVIAGDYARAETIGLGLARFQEALKNRQQFLMQQNTQYQQGDYSSPQPTTNAPPRKVRVSNGQETFEIDETDLQEAQSEGFNVVQ